MAIAFASMPESVLEALPSARQLLGSSPETPQPIDFKCILSGQARRSLFSDLASPESTDELPLVLAIPPPLFWQPATVDTAAGTETMAAGGLPGGTDLPSSGLKLPLYPVQMHPAADVDTAENTAEIPATPVIKPDQRSPWSRDDGSIEQLRIALQAVKSQQVRQQPVVATETAVYTQSATVAAAAPPPVRPSQQAYEQTFESDDAVFETLSATKIHCEDDQSRQLPDSANGSSRLDDLASDTFTLSTTRLSGNHSDPAGMATGSGVLSVGGHTQVGHAVTGGLQSPAAAAYAAGLNVNEDDFEEPLARRIMLMAGRGHERLRLSLNPPELGSLDIKLELKDGDVKLNLITHTAAARDALDAALPRLREMISNSGMNLVDAQVSHHHPQGGGHPDYDPSGRSSWSGPGDAGEAERAVEDGLPDAPRAATPNQSIVDIFA